MIKKQKLTTYNLYCNKYDVTSYAFPYIDNQRVCGFVWACLTAGGKRNFGIQYKINHQIIDTIKLPMIGYFHITQQEN